MILILIFFIFHSFAFKTLRSDLFKHCGYLEVDQSSHTNIFYWFFEAQNGEINAPIIMWLHGGPGCSGAMGLFGENGPYTISNTSDLVSNPFSWNTDFHLLFIDSPVGTGFSYEDPPHSTPLNEDDVSNTLYTFLNIFFSKLFPIYSKNELYIFGDSYSGKMVPYFVNFIDSHFSTAPFTSVPFNIKGYGIGNGLGDPVIQSMFWAEYSFQTGILGFLQKQRLERLQHEFQVAAINKDSELCVYLWNEISKFLFENTGGINSNDIRIYGEIDFDDYYKNVVRFLNRPDVRKSLNVGNHTFTAICNHNVTFRMKNDFCNSITDIVSHLLQSGRYRILYFNGNFDPTLPPASHEAYLNSLIWDHQQDFITSKRKIWKTSNDETAGYFRRIDNLLHVTVARAGHMAAGDQREYVYELVKQFVFNNFQDNI